MGKEVVVINIRTTFGSILPSRLKNIKTDANTNSTNSPVQILLMRWTYKSNLRCALLRKALMPNLKALP